MYCILMDQTTKSYYMKPTNFQFYVYSDESMVTKIPTNAVLVQTECETQKEITTQLFNAGFKSGFIDDKLVILNKNDSYIYDPCHNEIAYAQFLLTKDQSFLDKLIVKEKLLTICQIKDESVLFPTVQLSDGNIAVLCYTDLKRIPYNLFQKYQGYKIVRMTFDAMCIVNDRFIAE